MPHSFTLLRVSLILIATLLCSLLALQTRPNAHPDEAIHLDAFQYFEQNQWPPDLNSDGLMYSLYGWSRVYTGEVVYLLYGGLIGGLQMWLDFSAADPYLPYRFLNVGLFSLTLTALFFTPCRWFNLSLLGLFFIVWPQVYYVYHYINSDAWGLSMSIFLFITVAHLLDYPPQKWTWRAYTLLGLLTGLIFLAKLPFWLSLLIPYALLTWHLFRSATALSVAGTVWRQLKQSHSELFLILCKLILISGGVSLLLAAPLKIIYPISQGDFQAQEIIMREARAIEGLRPSDGFTRAAQGDSYFDVLTDAAWWETSLKTLYGGYGYLVVYNPDWLYGTAVVMGLLSLGMTVAAVGLFSPYEGEVRVKGLRLLALGLAPVVILLNLAASLYNSWWIDFQPQGRYLFAALIPLSLLLVGTASLEPRRWQRLRWAMFAVMYALCLYSLTVFVLTNYILIRPGDDLYVRNPVHQIEPIHASVNPYLRLAGIESDYHTHQLEVTLFWRISSRINLQDFQGYATFVHIVTPQGERVAGADLPLMLDTISPTAGEGHFATRHKIDLPAEITPDSAHTLRVGLYHLADGRPLATIQLGRLLY